MLQISRVTINRVTLVPPGAGVVCHMQYKCKINLKLLKKGIIYNFLFKIKNERNTWCKCGKDVRECFEGFYY